MQSHRQHDRSNLDRIGGEMGISRSGLDLRVSQELSYHRQAFPSCHRYGGEGVPQVMESGVLKACTSPNPLPEGLKVIEWCAPYCTGDNPRIVREPFNSTEHIH